MRRAALAWALWMAVAPLHAQQADAATTLDAVRVLGTPVPLSRFPGAVDVVDGATLRDGQRQVSLAEALARVPGITVVDRQNFAQDLQLQSRGFGARSSFGIRGIRLVVDGVPASALDGQGQAASFPLGLLERIEVLRGPLALQHGNASGGAIIGHGDPGDADAAGSDAWVGSHGSWRAQGDVAGGGEALRWRVSGSRFATAGERAHAAASRTQLAGIAQWTGDAGDRLRLAVNSLWQPETDDPLGLTPEQWRSEPHGTAPQAIAFDTRKRIGNHQLGLRWERGYAPGRTAWLGAHGGRRDVRQFLAIPAAAQRAPTHAGGVIALARGETGVEAGHRWSSDAASLAVGLQAGRLQEHRRGFDNFDAGVPGVQGRLRRDERNQVQSVEAFAVGQWQPAAHWSVLAGARGTRWRMATRDRYVAAGNPDDSGALAFRQAAWSLGAAYAFWSGEVFASIGSGYELPTINELAYRPDGGSGFHLALRPSRTRAVEAGARWRLRDLRAGLATYAIDGRDEIVPALTSDGRSSYRNAGGTRRHGIEASIDGRWRDDWRYALALNRIHALFDGDAALAGKRMPGIPVAEAFAELEWRPRARPLGIAMEVRANGAVAVDDANRAFAPGSARLALRLQWRHAGGWQGFARIDNLFDRAHVGSVIVNDGNRRWFEPGAGRALTLGVSRGLAR